MTAIRGRPDRQPRLVAPLRRPFVTLLVAFALASFFLPVASAQEDPEETTTDITFYGHVFGFRRDFPMPMNTQFPEGEADLSQGIPGHTCGLDEPCEEDAENEVWLYSTAGFVQIKEYTQFDYAALHNERGLTKDTYLDMGRDIKAEWYMSADYHGWLIALCTPGAPRDAPWPVPCWNWDPGYLAQWQVEATIYTGILGEYGGAADEAPDIATAFAEGKLTPLATGLSEIVDVQSLEATGNPTVWKFDVNLGTPTRDLIKKEESYVVRFQWWSVKPDGSRQILPGADVWNVNSGEYYAPTITLPVKGAFNVEMVLPQFVYGKLVLLGVMNTPWGSYDVDQESVAVEIKNAKTGAVVEPRSMQRLADFSVAHGGHYKPVNVTYVWDFAADGLPPGDYEATITATNFKGSASASCTGGFTVRTGSQPGDIRIGECGVRTITDDQLGAIREGSASDAAATGAAEPDRPLLPAPELSLFLAPLGFVALRRWAK